jgi:hypothetical protein
MIGWKMKESEWGDLECLLKPTNTAITDGGLFSDTIAMNDVTVNDNNENEYEMKKNCRVTKPEKFCDPDKGGSATD